MPSSVAVLNRYGLKVMMMLGMDIQGICYYEILGNREKADAPISREFEETHGKMARQSKAHSVGTR